MTDREHFVRDCKAVRTSSPIVHNITNYVAMNFTANALLAAGASPVMSSCREEMVEIVTLCDSLVINIGCLDLVQIEAMELAAGTAHKLGKPWVLDPVGAGVSRLRRETALDLTREMHPAVIRCNASEILALAGCNIPSRGVDSSVQSGEAVEAALRIASDFGCVVSVSGQTDYITDGKEVETISNGSPLMPRVTAMGCAASAITGAFVAVNGNSFEAALNAMALMGTAGELAASFSKGTGTFQSEFLDVLSVYDRTELANAIRQ